MLRYIIWSFIFYWLFRLIFNFIVPVFKATRQMKEQVRDFQNRTEDQNNSYQGQPNNYHNTTPPHSQQRTTPPKTGDYIDFEEIK